jgi:hypothetical protein
MYRAEPWPITIAPLLLYRPAWGLSKRNNRQKCSLPDAMQPAKFKAKRTPFFFRLMEI